MESYLIQKLEEKGVEFDAEVGFGWYWTFGDKTDNKGYDYKWQAAQAAYLVLPWKFMRVVDRSAIDLGGLIVEYEGELEECMNFMALRKYRNVDLMYPSGRLASWVAK